MFKVMLPKLCAFSGKLFAHTEGFVQLKLFTKFEVCSCGFGDMFDSLAKLLRVA